MKFRINHETRAFHHGTIIPLIAAAAALVIFIFLGFDISYYTPTMVLVGIEVLCSAAELIFIVLYIGEKIWGTKIIVESDCLDIRMFLRRKKLPYSKIDDVKYTHYEDSDTLGEHKRHSSNIFVRYRARKRRVWIRSKLIIYLSSGKKLILNDDAADYAKRRKLWITEPNLDPDENVKLYQAYKCCLAASHQYWKNQ